MSGQKNDGEKTIKGKIKAGERSHYKLKDPKSRNLWTSIVAIAIAILVLVLVEKFAIELFDGLSHNISRHEAHVGLVVMAKNENRTIVRLLDSVKGHVQSIVVCDTGSDDGTLKTLNDYAKSVHQTNKYFKLLIFQHKWTDDFARNRNLCLNVAREIVPEMDYILTIDADETLQVNDKNWKQKIEYDHNLINYEGNNHHPLPRLINTKFDFKYICTIHEFIAHLPNATSGSFYGVSIVNHADGYSSKGDNRHSRNFRLLAKGLERGPKNECYSRYVFYMAEALYEKGDWLNSTVWHQKRVALGGYKEEIYHSIYKMGMALHNRGGLPTNISGIFLQAWESRPWRAEALYRLAELHKNHRNYNSCKMFAERAIMPFPVSDMLFVHRSIYTWETLDMAGYCSFFTGDYVAAKQHYQNALNAIGENKVKKIAMLEKNIRLCDEHLT